MSQSATPPRPPGPSGPTTHVAAAGAAVLALTRAARSFTLYDPANKVVRQLIGDYREKVRSVLDAHGPLALEVHPFELMLGADQVYLERDRERSLAFRLFRDGVRRITLLPSVTWEELLRLLEILSVRFTGVRQQEDDLVTLLRKAEFGGITIAAIEGYAPEEERAEPGEGATSIGGNARFEAPSQWDVPLPPTSEAVALRYRDVSPEALARLRAEEAPDRLPEQGMQAALRLLNVADEASDREAAEAFAREVHEFLVVEGRTDLVTNLASALGVPAGSAESLDLRALLLAQPAETQDVPPDLASVLDAAGDEAMNAALDLISAEGEGPRLPFLLRVALRACGGSAATVEARLREAPEEHTGALLQVLAELDPPKALAGLLEAIETGGHQVHLQALAIVTRLRPGPAHLRVLRRLLSAGTDSIRLRAIRLLPKVGGARAFAVLESYSQEHAAKASPDDMVALGQALSESDQRAAMELFRTWVRSGGGGLLGRLTGGGAAGAQQRIALAGLEHIQSSDATELLEQLAGKGDPALRVQAATILASRSGSAASAPTGGQQNG